MGPDHGRGGEEVKVVLMLNLTLTGDEPFGVALVDENAQVEPVGRVVVVQAKLTCWLKPLSGVTIRV